MDLKILPELRDFLPGVPQETDELLEQQLLAAGCAKEPIIVWNDVIVDGHRRYGLCLKHGLPFRTEKRGFADIEAVKDWMTAHQLCRRNMTPKQRAELLASRAERNGLAKSVDGKPRAGGGNERALEATAKEAGVSTRTVRRAVEYREALDKLPQDVRVRVEALDASQKDITDLADYSADQQRELLDEVESGSRKTIGHAIRGSHKPEDLEGYVEPTAEEQADSVSDKVSATNKCIEALGILKRKIGDLAQIEPGVKFRTKQALLSIGDILAAVKAGTLEERQTDSEEDDLL